MAFSASSIPPEAAVLAFGGGREVMTASEPPLKEPSRVGRGRRERGTHQVVGAGGWLWQRHGNRVNRLGKPADQRKALLRSLTTEVIRHGRIKTTLVRAKVGGGCPVSQSYRFATGGVLEGLAVIVMAGHHPCVMGGAGGRGATHTHCCWVGWS